MSEHRPKPDVEPVGIVISIGKRTRHTPRLLAYIWAQDGEWADEPAPAETHTAELQSA